ncbi:hypothetical protein GUJ93_ZPchr0006g41854 [Zizania palustris]|uniref:Uncharacterized protein n=1 Tax=Zizania palustris TaxID=103762 RepID=A0A8J5SIH1_ZIZPA|nr:hypothetical protein GUJ93_ZPchr0006g41854 [Zizania palustris]
MGFPPSFLFATPDLKPDLKNISFPFFATPDLTPSAAVRRPAVVARLPSRGPRLESGRRARVAGSPPARRASPAHLPPRAAGSPPAVPPERALSSLSSSAPVGGDNPGGRKGLVG